MVKHPLRLAIISAVISLGAATQATAGCCPGCNCGPGTVVEPVIIAGPKSYLVNPGPVFSGPGHYVGQYSDPPPRKYPYVGFIFSGYPYGYHNPYVGAPRRFYLPR